MKIKWGVIGCGGIADRRTLPGMMLAENAELIAVMDANKAAADNCKEKYHAKYAFDNIEELLAIDEIQAVYIASPVFCHKEQAFAAADAKKDILIEKPVGLTSEEAEEIAAYCELKGVKLGVGFMMRFHSYHQVMKELVQSGKIGEIVSARAQLTCWYPEMENCWRQDIKLSGGGAMMDMGVHCVDLIRYITGMEVKEAAGIVGNQIFNYSVEDAGAVIMRLENGAIAYVDANFNIPDDAAKCKIEFYGTKGSIFAQGTISQVEGGEIEVLCADETLGYDASQNRNDVAPMNIEVEFGNMYTKEIEAFGKAVAGMGDIPITAKEAIASQKVIEAAYISSNSKQYATL
ncbi:MAG: Gfo/Idh/MocA family oxidoreductase [Ruminococcaceae bacterium]|nr:Gfo/Idh/MocA family oxidoreductase [Oscillospiraceae bacterium]